jgi:hypothetical protein
VQRSGPKDQRLWELAGASHYDVYGVAYLLPQYQTELPNLSKVSLNCKNSFDQVPERYVVNAAMKFVFV